MKEAQNKVLRVNVITLLLIISLGSLFCISVFHYLPEDYKVFSILPAFILGTIFEREIYR